MATIRERIRLAINNEQEIDDYDLQTIYTLARMDEYKFCLENGLHDEMTYEQLQRYNETISARMNNIINKYLCDSV